MTKTRLLIAASGTGGHLFPALALAESLENCQIDWLGVPDRLEQTLVPKKFPLHEIPVGGFQSRKLSLGTVRTLMRLLRAVFRVKKLLQTLNVDVIFTTGGYIAGPTILAARWQGIPVILHESNCLPGKVTRWFGPWCHLVALGFQASAKYLPKAKIRWVGTPVRSQFYTPQPLDLPLPDKGPVIVVVGGSQGAVAVNQLVRQCAPAWLEAGMTIVHLVGDRDPEAKSLQHSHYLVLPFYDNMAGLLQRADLVISRAGAGTLAELAITNTPAILIPYPYAAEDHQTYNANVCEAAEAAYVYQQGELTAQQLEAQVLELVRSPQQLQTMAANMKSLAVFNSTEQLAELIQQTCAVTNHS